MEDAMVVTVDRAIVVSARRWTCSETTSARMAEEECGDEEVESTAVQNCDPPPTAARWSGSTASQCPHRTLLSEHTQLQGNHA